MSRTLPIGSRKISDESPCYVIAEVGHNHQGDLETCREMFQTAATCGASAVKLQKRDNRSLYSQAMFEKPYDNENSFGATYGEHREALEFGRDEYKSLKTFTSELEVDFFATAFDFSSADFLAELDVPAFKIASGDLRNIPLMRHVAAVGKPILISTGGASMDDVQRAYDEVMPINSQLCIMQCTAGYPAEFRELDLLVIATYRDRFPDAVIGYSGHDNGIAMPTVAYVLGARVVEKHFTLNRAMKGTDHAFSLEPVGMRKMVRDLERAHLALGDGEKKVYASETSAILKMGKKLVAARDIPAGHVLSAEDVAIKSPGDGLPPYELDRILGLTTIEAVAVDESFTLENLSDPAPGRSGVQA